MTDAGAASLGEHTSLGALIGVSGDLALSVTSITNDSRTVTAGSLFAALPGANQDGRDFIRSAIDKGAAAILSTPDMASQVDGTAFIASEDPRRLYAQLCARIAGAQPDIQIAVTGTNGKTSVADFMRQLWASLGYASASYGTLGFRSQVLERPGGLTTPDPRDLHRELATAKQLGVTHLALEASSHGLDQRRLDGMHLSAAAFTNLTRDHLDYHGTFEAYYHAKARLFFDLLPPGGLGVTNIDDPYGVRLAELLEGLDRRVVRVGGAEDADLRLIDHTLTSTGQEFTLVWEGVSHRFDLPLMGRFQAENVALAIGLLIGLGEDPAALIPHAQTLKGVPGRMEYCGHSATGGAVYIDYAHTPDGLQTVLQSARAHVPKGLSVVFGCGGNRDTGKRPEMGRIAREAADQVYVTDDNPRFEDPALIRREILTAVPEALEIGDRFNAIRTAIDDLKDGEILIIAGKGHETGQLIGGETLPFSDLDCVAECLARQKDSQSSIRELGE